MAVNVAIDKNSGKNFKKRFDRTEHDGAKHSTGYFFITVSRRFFKSFNE